MRYGSTRTLRPVATATSHRSHRSRALLLLRSYGLVVPLVALVAACGRGGNGASPQSTPTSAAMTPATTSTSVATDSTTRSPATTGSRPTVAEPAVIANGTHSVYLAGVDAARRTISIDVVQVIDPNSSEAATVCPEVARGDHDGYCVKNENSQLRTVPVTDEASLQVLSGSRLRSVDMEGLAAARQGQNEDNFFQVTVSGGKVSSAKELFRA